MSKDRVPLRIAFDMDGVLADMHAALTLEAEQLFATPRDVATLEDALERPETGAPAVRLPASPYLHLTSGQTDQLWRHVAQIDNFWEGLKEIDPGAVARLARLARERRWEVIFLTQRPPTLGAIVQQQTQRWLQQHGFDLPSVYTTRRSRGAIAAALDLNVVIDDRFDGCVDVAAQSDARAVLVWREPDEAVPDRAQRLGITVVGSVGECLDLLERVDGPNASKPGLMSRIKDALRLKQSRT